MKKPLRRAPIELPTGEVVIRTIAMPGDANGNGDMFGGWIVSQMDIGGAILARALAHSRITTVAIDSMSFIRPVYVGDIVTCYARLLKIGRSSMKFDVEVWVQRSSDLPQLKVTEGKFTYVAIDQKGRPRAVRRKVPAAPRPAARPVTRHRRRS